MKILVHKILFTLYLTIGILALVEQWYVQVLHQPNDLPRALLPAAEISEPYQLVITGNSHAQSGITTEAFNIRALNLTGVAQRFRFDLALLKQHRRQIAPNATVLITVTPLSFSHRPADRHDGLQGNYYGRLSPFLIPDLKLRDYLQVEIFPQLRSGFLLRQNHAIKVRDRVAASEKWAEATPPPSQTAANVVPIKAKRQLVMRPHRDQMFFNVEAIEAELATPSAWPTKTIEENTHFVYHKWYETDEFGPQHFNLNQKELEQLIRYVQKQGWRPLLITLPVSHQLEETLLDDYMEKYLYQNLSQIKKDGVAYWDFSRETNLAHHPLLWGNADHLNNDGAKIMSYLLLQKLIAGNYVPTTADSYDYEPLYTWIEID